MTAYLGEFIGAMILISFGGGVVAGVTLKGSKSENGSWTLICVAWGLAVTLAIYAVGDISDAHLNPAVTLALAATGQFPWSSVPGYVLAQVGGCFAGGVIVWLSYLAHWKATESQDAKLGIFSTIPAVRSYAHNVLSEAIATFFLVFGLMFMGATEFSSGVKPLVVGALIAAIGFSFGGTTGFAINPARDLGPRLAHALLPIPGKGHSDWSYAWVPVLGPLIGGILGGLCHQALF